MSYLSNRIKQCIEDGQNNFLNEDDPHLYLKTHPKFLINNKHSNKVLQHFNSSISQKTKTKKTLLYYTKQYIVCLFSIKQHSLLIILIENRVRINYEFIKQN